MEDLIGRKVRGFYYTGYYKGFSYSKHSMDKRIGEVGEILSFDGGDGYCVGFEDGETWFYPAELIKDYLVEEWVVGEEYEFSDGDDWSKCKLLAVLPGRFSSRFIVESTDTSWTHYNNIRHVQPDTKEVTIEEAWQIVAEKLGVSPENLSIVVK